MENTFPSYRHSSKIYKNQFGVKDDNHPICKFYMKNFFKFNPDDLAAILSYICDLGHDAEDRNKILNEYISDISHENRIIFQCIKNDKIFIN